MNRLITSMLLLVILISSCTPPATPGGTDIPLPIPVTPIPSPTETELPATPTLQANHAPAAIPQGAYEIGTPTLLDLWVDINNGDDSHEGATRETALKSLDAAWNRIPKATQLTSGYHIHVLAGDYPAETLPIYWESRYGSYEAPIIIEAEAGPGTVVLQGFVNVFDVHYIYFINVDIIPRPAGDVFHCEKCDHLLIRGGHLNGGAQREAHETVKINQSQYIYLESNNISGADDHAVDFVAVQYGQVLANKIHDANDWCAYVKGGSAYLLWQVNEIYDCGAGGFTAGQATGLQYMIAPWLNYEAYGIVFMSNVIHDTEGAGLGVNGGFNIIYAYNLLARVGSRSHTLEFVFGLRSCDGQANDPGRERCQQYLDAGAWGTTVIDDGTNAVRIPNKNVFFYNNIIYNADLYSGSQNMMVAGPWTKAYATEESKGPIPAAADDNLQIMGNIIWDGGADWPLGIEGTDQGCQPTNPTCNTTQLRNDNAINTLEPQLDADFCPVEGSNVFYTQVYSLPTLDWGATPTVPAWQPPMMPTLGRPGTCTRG